MSDSATWNVWPRTVLRQSRLLYEVKRLMYRIVVLYETLLLRLHHDSLESDFNCNEKLKKFQVLDKASQDIHFGGFTRG